MIQWVVVVPSRSTAIVRTFLGISAVEREWRDSGKLQISTINITNITTTNTTTTRLLPLPTLLLLHTFIATNATTAITTATSDTSVTSALHATTAAFATTTSMKSIPQLQVHYFCGSECLHVFASFARLKGKHAKTCPLGSISVSAPWPNQER